MLAVSIKAVIVVTTMLKMKALCNNKLYLACACRYMQDRAITCAKALAMNGHAA